MSLLSPSSVAVSSHELERPAPPRPSSPASARACDWFGGAGAKPPSTPPRRPRAAEDVEQHERLLLSAPLRPMHHCLTLQSATATWSGKLRACDTDTLASALSALNAPTVGAHTALVRRLVMIFKLMGKPESLLQRWSMSTLRAVVGPGCSNHDKAVLVHDLVSRFFPDEAGCDGDSPLDAVSS